MAKAEVCKTSIQRFESARRLHFQRRERRESGNATWRKRSERIVPLEGNELASSVALNQVPWK